MSQKSGHGQSSFWFRNVGLQWDKAVCFNASTEWTMTMS